LGQETGGNRVLGKIRFHRRSIVLTWLLSYLAILLLPVVISIIVYTESSRTLESEIHEANRSLLNQVREVMDNQFKLMERLTLEMRTNVKVGDLLYSKRYQDVPNEYIYNRYLITQDLKQVKTSYPLIDLFYIYIAETNTILLPGLVREGPFGYQLIHRDNGFSYDKWHSVVNLPDFKGFIPMVRMNEDEIRRKSAAYVTTFPSDDGKAVATSVVMIDEARLLGAIQNVELFNQGHVFVLNSNNEVIISNSNGKLQLDIPLGEMMESSGLFYYVQDDQKFEAMYIKSSVSGLKYVSLIPSRLYWEKAEHVRRLTYMSMLFSVIGGGLLAYVFLRKNYNPVRQLVQVFSDKAEVPFGSGHNEFQFIRQALDSTLSQMDKILDQMKQQRHVLRSNFISRLMKGRLDNQIPIDDTLVTFNMRFYSNDFAVILFHVEKSAPFHERTSSMDPNDRLKLLQFIVTNVVEELAKERNGGFVAEVDEALAHLSRRMPRSGRSICCILPERLSASLPPPIISN
jgi:two-component system response regulator YesN